MEANEERGCRVPHILCTWHPQGHMFDGARPVDYPKSFPLVGSTRFSRPHISWRALCGGQDGVRFGSTVQDQHANPPASAKYRPWHEYQPMHRIAPSRWRRQEKLPPVRGLGPDTSPRSTKAHQSTWRGRGRVDRVIGPAIDLSGVWSGEKVRSSPFKARLQIFIWSLAGGSLRKTVGPLAF